MGLLDDLRNQADSQRENEAAEAERQAKLQTYYEETMQPRMVKAFQFFTEFVNHLNYIKLETFVGYPLLPNGVMQRLQQQNYKVVIDSSKALKEIKFTMECVMDEPVEFDVFGKDAIQLQIDKIKRYSFRHECKTRSINQEVNSAKFILEGPLPLAVNITADLSESKIKVDLRNFNEPGYAKYDLSAEEFDDAFLDRLGKFVIRQERTLFGGEEISDEAKKVLRDKIIVERRIREQEMREAEARIKAQEAATKERSAKEQLKRAVNTKVARGKESLKDMFGKLKKQAGFDSTTTDATLPLASVPTKQPAPVQPAAAAPKPKQPAPVQPAAAAPKPKQPAPVQPAAAAPKPEQPAPIQPAIAAAKPEQPAPVQPAAAAPKPKQPAPVQPAAAAPKPEQPAPVQPATAAPKPEQPAPIQPATAAPKPEQPAPVQPATVAPKPQALVTQVSANSEQKKQEPATRVSKNPQPPKVYIAPPGNPFLTPDESGPSSEQENDLDSKLKQKDAKAEEKSASELEDEKTSSSNLSLTPEDLENDLVKFMQRETQANPEVKSVQDSVEKVELETTASPESKLELALEHEPTRESESETKVEQKPDPEPDLAIEPEAKSNPNLELALEPSKETSPSNPFLASEGPDIDLSAPSHPTQEEMGSDVSLTPLFSSSNKKPKE